MWQCGALLCPPPIKIGIFYQLTCIGYSLHAAQRSTLQYAITVTVMSCTTRTEILLTCDSAETWQLLKMSLSSRFAVETDKVGKDPISSSNNSEWRN